VRLKRLLILYHSQSGAAHKLAGGVAAGAKLEQSIELKVHLALEAELADLLWADGLIVVTPENFGAMSGAVKDFFDRTFYPAQVHAINIPYMMVVSAGNDGRGAVSQLQRICRGYPMKQVAEPLIVLGEPSAADIDMAAELGQAMAAGLAIGIF
jgi:multimeric flavodoxin WrbA